MIYSKIEGIGIRNTQGLISAVPLFLLEAKEKKFVIMLTYANGMQTSLQFNAIEERDKVLKAMIDDLKCLEVK